MGGGGTGAPSYGGATDTDKLQDVARQELERPAPEPRRRVFLSFKGEDKTIVDLFRGQAKNENSDLDFIDFSLRAPFNSENAEYIRSGIRERIKQSSVTIVCLTEDTHTSEWVDWEIRESIRLGKGVIGVRMKDDASIKTPKAMEENRCKVVNWNHEEIRQAMNEADENR
jgi:hypothetical protein